MLYRLEIENFYSVRDPQVLDLRIGRSVPDRDKRFAPIFPTSPDRVAKTVALFGPNGSGKSTVLKALSFLSWFLTKSFHFENPTLPILPFNDEESASRPIKLCIELGGLTNLTAAARLPENLAKNTDWSSMRYELEIAPVPIGSDRKIAHECLRMRRDGQGKWARVFERTADGDVKGSDIFPLSGYSAIVEKIRPNVSVVATLALFKHEPSEVIQALANQVFTNIVFDRVDFDDRSIAQYLAAFPIVVADLNRELQRIDLGIDEMRVEQSAVGPELMFKHRGLRFEMPWISESHGTRAFIKVYPRIFGVLATGGIALLDEFDLSIHPLVLPEIVGWFRDPERNPRNAQLWMSCHSVSLMEELTKEEIAFCEKDSSGRTKLYSLMDVGAVRRDDHIYKKYLSGTYGAVPHIG